MRGLQRGRRGTEGSVVGETGGTWLSDWWGREVRGRGGDEVYFFVEIFFRGEKKVGILTRCGGGGIMRYIFSSEKEKVMR